jgi:hypothetical protein
LVDLYQKTASIIKKDGAGQDDKKTGIPPYIKQERNDDQPKLGGVHLKIAQKKINQQGQRQKKGEESYGIEKHFRSLGG